MTFSDLSKFWGSEWSKLSQSEKTDYKNMPSTSSKPSRRVSRGAAKQARTVAVRDAVDSAVGSAMDTAVATGVSTAVSSAFAAQSTDHTQHAAPMDYETAHATIVKHKQTEMKADFEEPKTELFNEYKIKMMKKQLQHQLDNLAGADVDLDGMEVNDEEFANLLH
jgi:hypothetical protein